MESQRTLNSKNIFEKKKKSCSTLPDPKHIKKPQWSQQCGNGRKTNRPMEQHREPRNKTLAYRVKLSLFDKTAKTTQLGKDGLFNK